MTTTTTTTATTSNILGANGSPGYSCTATLDWRLGCVQRTELPNLPNLPTCLQSWLDLPMKLTQLACLPLHPWLYRHFELPSTVRAENKVASTSRSGNGYTGTLIRRVALTDLVISLFVPSAPMIILSIYFQSFMISCSATVHFPLFFFPTFNPSEK